MPTGGRFTFVLRLSVLALAAPRLQLEEEHEASQNFIVNDTSGQTRPQGARLLSGIPVPGFEVCQPMSCCFCASVAGGAEA